jgi:hypothetical protein
MNFFFSLLIVKIGVSDLAENTVLLVPFRQEKLLGIYMAKMNVSVDSSRLSSSSPNGSSRISPSASLDSTSIERAATSMTIFINQY